MANNLRENAQYIKGKTPVIREYLNDHTKLLAEIAGRGFLNLPGYAYDLENDLELKAKSGLSELNYKILAETIERELKQAGIDYNAAYQTAAIAWEIEKQSLMAVWDQELSGIRQGMAEEEEVKDRLALEVKARQVTLIEAKTAIDIEMEGYRKQIAELEDDTAEHEVSLANAKLLTAEKKLELIPILQEICTKEQELLSLEQDKAGELTTLLNAKQGIATKKATLIPWYAQLATLTETYAGLIPGIIAMEEQIADEKISQAEAQIDKAENDLLALEIDINTANKEIEVGESKRDLRTTQFDNRQTIIKNKINQETEHQNEIDGYYDRIIADDRATHDEILSEKEEINNIQNATKIASTTRITDEHIDADNSMSTSGIYERGQIATIKSAGQITAQLRHVIS